jgi:hypothetical protein
MSSSQLQNENNNESTVSVQQPRNCIVEFVCKNRNLVVAVLVIVALCVVCCDFSNDNTTLNLSGGGRDGPLLNNFLNTVSTQSEFQFSL